MEPIPGETDKYRALLLEAIPFVKKSAASFAEIDYILNFDNWELVERGGDHLPGSMSNTGQCPCQHDYTVRTRQTYSDDPPTPAQKAECLRNPPLPDRNAFPCPGDCVNVMTHTWNGYSVWRNTITGKHLLNCTRFAQFHCKKPDDPGLKEPPIDRPPNPT